MLKRYQVTNEEYTFHTFKKNQVFNLDIWLENKGDFEKLEDGSYAIYYNDDKTIDRDKVQITKKDAQSYLDSTGWIIEKMSELSLEGGDTSPLLLKYEYELTERKKMRELL